MPRIFIALLPDAATRDRLQAICSDINGAKWTPPDQLHVTLRFLGNVSEVRAREIEAVLHEVHCSPLTISVGGVGTFPDATKRSLNVLWVGVEATPELRDLQTRVDDALEMIGLDRESRPYHPHITVARIRYADPIGIDAWLGAHGSLLLPTFTANGFSLMESQPGVDGSVYQQIQAYRE
jgi:RNA 2',3'-cyclic 3'-phosphodiesterase